MLRARGIEHAFGRTPVLAGVDLDVEEGRLVGLVGPNGAGKSTLLRCLHGALRPRAGTVELEDRDVFALSRRVVARTVAVVPQRCEVPFPVPVRQFVELGRFAHESLLGGASAHDRAVVERVLAELDLVPLADRGVDELSGGEFRRVLLAQALAQEPRVLLFDEPIQQLDLRHQLEVLAFARAFTRRGGTAGVIVMHELALAARVCDELVLLDAGRVVARGAPEAVLTAENVARVFGVDVVVERSPATGALQIVPTAERAP